MLALGLPCALLAGIAHAGPSALETVGPKQCAECHESEVEVWKQTSHYAHARTLSRKPKAKSIAKAMGVRRMNTDERCSSCHFTVTQSEGRRARSAGGVSCESCHGPAKNWIEIHGNYGGPTITRATEAALHREQRIGTSKQAGMHRAADLYELTSTCYDCHVVGDEQLVNRGGHSAGGSLDFVGYTQGEMRHNFVRGARDQNEISKSDRQHQMYVVSRVLELEYALRALAEATEAGPYAERQANFVKRSLAELQQVAKHAPSTELAAAIQSAQGVSLTANQRASALAAAKRVQASGRALSAPARAPGLAGVRPLLTRPSSRAEP